MVTSIKHDHMPTDIRTRPPAADKCAGSKRNHSVRVQVLAAAGCLCSAVGPCSANVLAAPRRYGQSVRRFRAQIKLRRGPSPKAVSGCARGGRSAFARRGPAARVQSKSAETFHAALSAVEISVNVAFSASLIGTPPTPRNPPSLDASATCWLICCSHPLYAEESPGALASTIAAASRNVSIHLSLIWAGLLSLNLALSASRAALPSAELKSSTTALMSALAFGSVFTFASSVPPAKLSFRRPHSPLGSAAVIAIPAAITLSKRTFHSSGVKLVLPVMAVSSSAFACLRLERRHMALRSRPA